MAGRTPRRRVVPCGGSRGDRSGQAYTLSNLGQVHHRQGHHQAALDRQRESLALRRELAEPHGQAECLQRLGSTFEALGRLREARTHWLDALAILADLGSSDADQVRALLADLPLRGPQGDRDPGRT